MPFSSSRLSYPEKNSQASSLTTKSAKTAARTRPPFQDPRPNHLLVAGDEHPQPPVPRHRPVPQHREEELGHVPQLLLHGGGVHQEDDRPEAGAATVEGAHAHSLVTGDVHQLQRGGRRLGRGNVEACGKLKIF